MTSDVAIYSANDEIRLLLRGLLRLHHYRIVGEGSAPASLLEIPREMAPVVVLDADLDEMGWVESIQELHRHRPELRVVLLTATRSPRVGTQAKATGIDAVVRRPFPVRELLEAVTGGGAGPLEAEPPKGTSLP
jgi:two-component system, OmpR family, response regulator